MWFDSLLNALKLPYKLLDTVSPQPIAQMQFALIGLDVTFEINDIST